MCGIAGCLTVMAAGAAIGADVFEMTRSLSHRGPDDEGLFLWRRDGTRRDGVTDATVPGALAGRTHVAAELTQPWHVVLGHRRFSILDITPAGHQPFLDPAGRAALVFNGEIYNYLELRAELEAAGVAFHTRSDTEVLLQAYLTWGEAMLERLNGMWAIALLDLRSGRLLLSRDRVGEKPLFYTYSGDRLYFSSEIKSLFQVPAIHAARQPDDQRVWDFLYLGLRDHLPGSFFHNIHQIPPGHLAWVEPDGRMETRCYWRLPRTRLTAADLSFEEAANQFHALLKSSIMLRLRADVPVAAELSGGLDSSSIVRLASDHLRETGAAPLQTVTIRYADREFDESSQAREVAEACQSPWTALTLEAEQYWQAADSMATTQAQPYESPNQLGSLALWTWMRDRKIRVSLNGGAGDELLAGYIGHHLLPYLTEEVQRGHWRGAWREGAHWWGGPYLNPTTLRRFLVRHLSGADGRWYLARMLRMPFFAALRRPPPPEWATLLRHGLAMHPSRLSHCLLAHSEFAPLPMYMVHGDKLSMSVPIEIRFPYLDPRLMDFAFRLPIEHFFRAGYSKAILRHALRGRLPAAILEDRIKRGFPVPLQRWMREGRERITAELKTSGRCARFLDIDAFCAGFERWDANLIWRVHQVDTWMRLHDLH